METTPALTEFSTGRGSYTGTVDENNKPHGSGKWFYNSTSSIV